MSKYSIKGENLLSCDFICDKFMNLNNFAKRSFIKKCTLFQGIEVEAFLKELKTICQEPHKWDQKGLKF